jgi:formate hydrogenlyase subunit 4
LVGQLLTGVFYLFFFLICSGLVLALGLLIEGVYGRWSVPGAQRSATSILQPFRDLLKLFRKESLLPAGSNRGAFLSMPLVGLACACLMATILVGNVLWQNGLVGHYRFVGDILVVLFLLPLPMAALIFGAGCSNSPLAAVASSRGVRMLACMLPLILAVVAALVLACAAEQRFSRGLNRQVSRLAGRDSMLHPRRARLYREALPLRISEMLVLRGAGPDETGKLMVGRAALRMRPVRRSIARQLEGLKDKLEAAKQEMERTYDQLHSEGRTPSEALEVRAATARADYEWLFDREKQLAEDARNADWLTGTRQYQQYGLSGARLVAAGRGGRFARIFSLLALILCVVVAVLCIAPLAGLSPFDFGEGQRALAGGALAEYSGPLLGFWRLTRAAMLVVLPLFIGLVFMGGFRGPLPENVWFYQDLLAFGKDAGYAWRGLLVDIVRGMAVALKFFLIIYGLALLRRVGWKPRAVDSMRLFVGPASLIAFCALFIAVVLLWSGA